MRSKRAILAVMIGLLAAATLACAASRADQDAPSGFPIDRRPVLMLRLWNGSYEAPGARGLSREYRGDDAPQRIVERLDALYAEGWRRIVMTHPAGTDERAAQWGSIEQWTERSLAWQSGMRNALAQWRGEHPDATLGVYMGLRKQDGDLPTADELGRFLGPWLQCGVTEFVFDASARPESHAGFDLVNTWLRERGGRAVMEALPLQESGEPDRARLHRHPAMSLERFVESRQGGEVWRFDARATEVWIGVGRAEALDKERLQALRDRGFVLQVYSANEQDRRTALDVAARPE